MVYVSRGCSVHISVRKYKILREKPTCAEPGSDAGQRSCRPCLADGRISRNRGTSIGHQPVKERERRVKLEELWDWEIRTLQLRSRFVQESIRSAASFPWSI